MINAILLFAVVSLVPGSSTTWTDGTQTWAGNPYCAEAGVTLQPGSPAIDAGTLIPGFHCDTPGPSLTGCQEWYGKAPDIGACEYVAQATTVGPPLAPTNVKVVP